MWAEKFSAKCIDYMSRVGKQPLTVPQGSTIKSMGNVLTITGPKGTLSLTLPSAITVTLPHDDVKTLSVQTKNEKTSQARALWGTYTRLIKNTLIGVTEGFTKKLIISGVGYRANIQGKNLVIEVGFSHPVEFPIPSDVTIQVEPNNALSISGIDKHRVGQVAAEIRNVKKPEPYKGKGIAYGGEIIRRKQGKQAASSAK